MDKSGVFATVAVAAAIIAAAVGCSASGGAPNGGGAAAAKAVAPHTPPAVPVSGLTRGMVLPLEAYEETFPEYTEILKARFAIESRCMSGYGFSFAPTPDTASISYDGSNMARRYGLADPAEAAQDGYSVPATARAASDDPALSPQEYLVLTGATSPGGQPSTTSTAYKGRPVPVGGCVGQANAQLTDPANDMLVNQLDAQSLDDSQALPEVKAVIARWSDCMRQAGYQAADPLKASLLTQQAGAAPGGAVDRKIAMADVACKSRTDLIGVWFAAESGLQQQAIATNGPQLRQDYAKLTAARDKAATILAAGTG